MDNSGRQRKKPQKKEKQEKLKKEENQLQHESWLRGECPKYHLKITAAGKKISKVSSLPHVL